jgi:ribonuclease D
LPSDTNRGVNVTAGPGKIDMPGQGVPCAAGRNTILVSESALDVWLLETGAGPRVCAIDTEADSLHRYRESLCLIQYAEESRSVLIDPLEIGNLAPLGRVLGQATVWMHGADYDMTMLRRQFGFLPPVVYDTQIGARLLGIRRFGLADLVLHYFGVELSKTSQKADWGKRPLSPKMIEYALNDVHYLLPMGEMISSGLRESGRYEWFVESCEASRRKVLERDECREEAWRIQGSGKLDRRGLAFLKALWQWRDHEAEAWDRPSFMVAPNREILEWAGELSANCKVRLPTHFRSERVARFRAAVVEVEAEAPQAWPEKIKSIRRRKDAAFDRRVTELIHVRNKAAEALDIDSSLIASRSVLEMIAGDECAPSEALLRWQAACLGMEG